MERASFTKSASGRLVEISDSDGHALAFIPSPLPPDITFDNEAIKA